VQNPESMGLPFPADIKILSSVTSMDDGRKGLTLSLTSPQSLDKVSESFVGQLIENNWKNIRVSGVKNAQTGELSQLISAQQGRKQAQVMLWTNGQTQAVVTIGESL
jgi:hypothetical protein